MSRRRTIWLAGGAALLLAIAAALWFGPSVIVNWSIDSAVRQTVRAQQDSEDRFAMLFCGTGSPQTSPDRGQACLAIVAGNRLFLFDAGEGASQQLREANAPIARLDTVFLTHMHSDHMSGLGEAIRTSWIYGREHGVSVVGPPGTTQILDGYRQLYERDIAERRAKAGLDTLEIDEIIGEAQEITVDGDTLVEVYNDDGIAIGVFRVDHPRWPYAYGYRFSYRGRTIVVSGDTRYSENLVRHATNADILVHEALNTTLFARITDALAQHGGTVDPERMTQVEAVHTTTEDVARVAEEADVGALYVTHLIPPVPANRIAENAFIEGMDDHYAGPIAVARDGMWIELGE